MYKLLLVLLCALGGAGTLAAQLTLTRLDGRRETHIPAGTKIAIRVPTPTQVDTCDCHHEFTGILQKSARDTAFLNLEQDIRFYYDDQKIARRVTTYYDYKQSGPVQTVAPLHAVYTLTRFSKTGETLDDLGGVILLLTSLHSLLVAPLLSQKERKVSDAIVYGGVGVGLAMLLWPNEKHFNLQAPKRGKPKPLWRIQSK